MVLCWSFMFVFNLKRFNKQVSVCCCKSWKRFSYKDMSLHWGTQPHYILLKSLRSLLACWLMCRNFIRENEIYFFHRTVFRSLEIAFQKRFSTRPLRCAHFVAIVRDNLSIPNAHVQTWYIKIYRAILRLYLQEIILFQCKFKWLHIL